MIAAIMKQPRFFYVKSSGNQRMRLSSSALVKMEYRQINLMGHIFFKMVFLMQNENIVKVLQGVILDVLFSNTVYTEKCSGAVVSPDRRALRKSMCHFALSQKGLFACPPSLPAPSMTLH